MNDQQLEKAQEIKNNLKILESIIDGEGFYHHYRAICTYPEIKKALADLKEKLEKEFKEL